MDYCDTALQKNKVRPYSHEPLIFNRFLSVCIFILIGEQFQFLTNIPLILSNIFLSQIEEENLLGYLIFFQIFPVSRKFQYFSRINFTLAYITCCSIVERFPTCVSVGSHSLPIVDVLHDPISPYNIAVQSVRHRGVKEILVKMVGEGPVGRAFEIHENVPLAGAPSQRQIGEFQLVPVEQDRVKFREIRVTPFVGRVTIVDGAIDEYIPFPHVKILVVEHRVPEQDLLGRVCDSIVPRDHPFEMYYIVEGTVEVDVEGEREDR